MSLKIIQPINKVSNKNFPDNTIEVRPGSRPGNIFIKVFENSQYTEVCLDSPRLNALMIMMGRVHDSSFDDDEG